MRSQLDRPRGGDGAITAGKYENVWRFRPNIFGKGGVEADTTMQMGEGGGILKSILQYYST